MTALRVLIGWTPSQWIRVAFVPAALYALQNVAALQAYQNLDSLTFNVLNRKFLVNFLASEKALL